MARQVINRGTTAGDGTGEQLYDAFGKVNSMTLELYNRQLTSSSDPTVNDDSGDGYAVGSTWFNTTTGRLFVLRDATVGAAVWEPQVPGDMFAGYQSGMFFGVPRAGAAATAAAPVGTLCLLPLIIYERQAFVNFTVRTGTGNATSGNVLIGLYSHDRSTKKPNALLQGSASTAIAATAGVSYTPTFSSITFDSGMYWIATLFDAAITMVTVSAGDPGLNQIMGQPTSQTVLGGGNTRIGYQMTQAFGSGLPSNVSSLSDRSAATPLAAIGT